MEINSNLQIALRVAGTKQRRAGFAPLVTVGVLAGDEGANMYRSTMVAERPAYVVKHAPEYILYQLIDRGAKPFDADANGVLSIALTISSNAQLADGKSPYNLLNEVYQKFVNTYMEPTSDGRLSFLDTDNDNEIFREIVSQYRLEKRKSTYIPMAQQGLTGIVCVPKEKLSEFFINTQYKEFATFKDVEVGISCVAQVTPGLDKLQIPLPPNSYDVWVNGKPVGVTMQARTDSYYAHADSTELYNYDGVEFSLAELIDAPMNRLSKNGASISLDSQKNRINCELKKSDILYDLIYDWEDRVGNSTEKILSLIKNGSVKLKLGSIDISKTLFGHYNIKASDIKGQKMEIKPQVVGNYSLIALSDIDHAKRQIMTKIIVNQRAIAPQQSISRPQTTVSFAGKQKDDHGIGNDDYSKGGTNNIQTGVRTLPDKRKLDMKSFLIGVVAGLILGLGIWGISSFWLPKEETNGINNAAEEPADSIVTKKDSLSMQQETESDADKVAESEEPAYGEVDANAQAAAQTEEEKLNREKIAKEKELRADLIRTINTKDYEKCKKHPGWNLLTDDEQLAVGAVLDPLYYKRNVNGQGGKLLKKIKEREFDFKTIDEVKTVHKEIIQIINDYKK